MRRPLRRVPFLFVLLAAFGSPAFAAEPTTQPSETRVIIVRVVDADTQQPLPDAMVSGNIVNDTDVPIAPLPDGTFRVEVPPDADSYFTVTASAPGRTPLAATWQKKDALPETF